jgi:subtilisin family serine protease
MLKSHKRSIALAAFVKASFGAVIISLFGKRATMNKRHDKVTGRRLTLRRPAILIICTALSFTASLLSNPSNNLAQSSEPRSQYFVEFSGNRLPDDLAARVTALGGTIVDRVPELKVVILGNMTDSAATTLRTQSDVSDVTLDELPPARDSLQRSIPAALFSRTTPSSSIDPSSALFFPYQWNMRATAADRVWQAGILGDPNVRIAIIDSGVDPTHPDLVGRIDTSRSVSFCPQEEPLVAQQFPGYPPWTDLLGHGTFVASIATSNGLFAAGVSSQSSIMALKVGGIIRCPGSGIFRSIIYAANNGADVINMSISRNQPFPRAGQKGGFHYEHLAIQYALVKGVSAVVVAAGNNSEDLDHHSNDFKLYCDVPGVICVSATGPTSAGPNYTGPFINVDSPSFYTNFGASAIDVAAPGGNLVFDQNGNLISEGWIWGSCATTDREILPNGQVVLGFCTSNGILVGPWLGTSFAAPHVSGLAALIVSRIGRGQSAQVRAAIANSADDLGKPGTDAFYGRGRINIARALNVP